MEIRFIQHILFGVSCLQMVAANIVQSFYEAGLGNTDKLAVVGKR